MRSSIAGLTPHPGNRRGQRRLPHDDGCFAVATLPVGGVTRGTACGDDLGSPVAPDGFDRLLASGSACANAYQLQALSTVASCRTSCYTYAMTRTIAQRELRNENAKVIEAVAAGETFIVTRNGEPVAELRPLRAGRRTFVAREEVAALATAGVRIDRHQFRADLDHVIDQGL